MSEEKQSLIQAIKKVVETLSDDDSNFIELKDSIQGEWIKGVDGFEYLRSTREISIKFIP